MPSIKEIVEIGYASAIQKLEPSLRDNILELLKWDFLQDEQWESIQTGLFYCVYPKEAPENIDNISILTADVEACAKILKDAIWLHVNNDLKELGVDDKEAKLYLAIKLKQGENSSLLALRECYVEIKEYDKRISTGIKLCIQAEIKDRLKKLKVSDSDVIAYLSLKLDDKSNLAQYRLICEHVIAVSEQGICEEIKSLAAGIWMGIDITVSNFINDRDIRKKYLEECRKINKESKLADLKKAYDFFSQSDEPIKQDIDAFLKASYARPKPVRSAETMTLGGTITSAKALENSQNNGIKIGGGGGFGAYKSSATSTVPMLGS